MKRRYADEVLIEVEVAAIPQSLMPERIEAANSDDMIHGIIVQLPLDDPTETDRLCDMIAPSKDVDGLGKDAAFPSATAEAIDWLLVGYNIDLTAKQIAILGNGKLVGKPLARLWIGRGLNVTVLDEHSEGIESTLLHSDVIVAATGVPRILTSEKIPIDAVVVDAGTSSEGGVIVGDVDPQVREVRNDLTITPEKGGVGPLTYTLLFDHLIQAALRQAGQL
jgi:methylenetetrahydrofolate dehydrogenase (NADP+)/methenyltetrahydrofolate cyclohydrolase